MFNWLKAYNYNKPVYWYIMNQSQTSIQVTWPALTYQRPVFRSQLVIRRRLLWDQATCVHKVSLIMIFQMFQFVRHIQTLYVIAISVLFKKSSSFQIRHLDQYLEKFLLQSLTVCQSDKLSRALNLIYSSSPLSSQLS